MLQLSDFYCNSKKGYGGCEVGFQVLQVGL